MASLHAENVCQFFASMFCLLYRTGESHYLFYGDDEAPLCSLPLFYIFLLLSANSGTNFRFIRCMRGPHQMSRLGTLNVGSSKDPTLFATSLTSANLDVLCINETWDDRDYLFGDTSQHLSLAGPRVRKSN